MRYLIAPYERDTGKLSELSWFDRSARTHDRHAISNSRSVELEDGRVTVQTYRDYFREYRLHPEAKALAPGGKPCHPWTRGLLHPPRVQVTRLARVGKETNPLADSADLILENDEHAIEYRDLRCLACGGEFRGRQRLWCSDACRKRWQREERRRGAGPCEPRLL